VLTDPLSLFRIWEGLSSFGGFTGAIIGGFLWKLRYRADILPYADVVASSFPTAWIFGRTGCSIAHDHPGLPSDAWFAVQYPDGGRFDLGLYEMLLTIPLALAFLWLGGGHALVWGYFVSTVLLWHGSFAINSLAHLWGKRRYETSDDSRNNWILALLTTGEGWHNNHHHYQSSANQGFRWWEVDVTFYVLRLLEALGLIWDLRRPPREVVEGSASSASPERPIARSSRAAA